MPLVGTEFLKHVESSGLLSGKEVAVLRAQPDAEELDAKAMAVRLVQQKKLTPWQARKLLAGRWRGFFIGNYKILEPLGQGGMATVFKAEHKVLRRSVALKVLPLEATSNQEAVDRFQREARAIAQLEHESIVQVYEIGQQGVAHFIVMEFVPGRKLSRLIEERGRLAASETAEVGYLTAIGLEHAVERGVIHRDIKPSNIIITPKGKVKILDMGLAMFSGDWADEAAAKKDLTHAGEVLGTVDYVAPEQAKNSRSADTRSDIYSLGCALYQCLTGRVPFPDGSLVEKLLAHREDQPPPIQQFAADTPPPLIAVVNKMMAKRPEDRYQRPAEVAQALSPFRASLSSLASAVTKTEPAAEARPQPSTPSRPSLSGLDATPSSAPVSKLGLDSSPSSVSNSTRSTTPSLKSLSDESPSAEPYDILQAIATATVQTPAAARSTTTTRRRGSPILTACLWIGGATVLIAALVWQWLSTNVGTLVIEIPAAERAELELLLDGQPVQLHGEKEARVDVKVGEHSLVVKREGYKPEEHSLTIRRGQELSIRPAGRSPGRRRS